ncbi:MAG: hypothetical protein EP330_06470 [Deltaproteobacteria bacterium]|nr:MAG: hypothetical protein EP330_06470 [Deltaproteobacteria bacterium]
MRYTAILMLVALGACDDGFNGGQSGSEQIGCLPTTTADLAVDETSPLGFTPQALLDLAEGSHTETFAFEQGGSVGVTVTFTASGQARFEEREYQDDGSGMEMAMDCEDAVVVPGTVTVVTDDGAVDESFDVELEASSADLASWFGEVASLHGSFQIDESPYDEVRYFGMGTFDADGSAGELSGQGESVDGEVASATNLPIGAWGN